MISYKYDRSTDLTLALYDTNNDNCAISDAPTIHFSGFPNTTLVCLDLGIWTNYSLNNPSSVLDYNYTISNGDKVTNSSSFNGLYYQQKRSSNIDQAQNPDNIGQLEVQVYPCPGCSSDCSRTGRSSGSTLTSSDEWLQWDCISEGDCYNTQETIGSFQVGVAVDKFSTLDSAEKNDKCQLAAVVNGNATQNNNTKLHENGGSAGTAIDVSKMGLLLVLALAIGGVSLM